MDSGSAVFKTCRALLVREEMLRLRLAQCAATTSMTDSVVGARL